MKYKYTSKSNRFMILNSEFSSTVLMNSCLIFDLKKTTNLEELIKELISYVTQCNKDMVPSEFRTGYNLTEFNDIIIRLDDDIKTDDDIKQMMILKLMIPIVYDLLTFNS